MASKINQTPNLPAPIGLTSTSQISAFLLNLINSLLDILRDMSTTINSIASPTNPTKFKTYVKAALPDAVANINSIIIVSNDIGGLTPAFSDGTNWRRTADRNIIS